MNKTIDALVTCPFYVREAELTVDCEGLTGGAVTVTRFRTKKNKTDFMKSFCVDCAGRGCPLAEFLTAKYE